MDKINNCWWASCSIEERPAGANECEECPELVELLETDEVGDGES